MKKDILLAKLVITELIQETIRPDAVKKVQVPVNWKNPKKFQNLSN